MQRRRQQGAGRGAYHPRPTLEALERKRALTILWCPDCARQVPQRQALGLRRDHARRCPACGATLEFRAEGTAGDATGKGARP